MKRILSLSSTKSANASYIPKSVSAVPDVIEEEKCPRCGVIIENADEIRRNPDKAWECQTCGASLYFKKRAAVAESVDAPDFGEPGAELAVTHVLQNALKRILNTSADGCRNGDCLFCGSVNEIADHTLRDLSEHAPKSESASGASSQKDLSGASNGFPSSVTETSANRNEPPSPALPPSSSSGIKEA